MAVTFRKAEDGSIRVEFPFDYERVARIKSIPGHSWIAPAKEWRLPGNPQTALKLAELFADDDIVFASGAEWFVQCLMGTCE